ncbi:uncharacterized protein LOC111379810 [Olea europaea var. sylvestris]|uniref:uncharacterized protein LOC111379810 n=1 Tax=Olea europaea var. sylvestris TaxID=158386 RepID=UPI000C1D4B79|nr:uncharacterized protein LOC111379810 [Olea europaea var. sylvestris]
MAHTEFTCELHPTSEAEDEQGDDAFMEELQVDIMEWFQYCQMNEVTLRNYYHEQCTRVSRYPFARNGHMFMLDAMNYSPQQCYAEFHMYPVMLRAFVHMLRDEYGLRSHQHVDIYEQVGMFLCILAHGKGYRQVQTLFNHSLETVGHYFKLVLLAVLEFSQRVIRPDPNYNNYAEHHVPNLNKHPIFRDCIGAIDRTHVRAVLPREQRVSFIGRKGIPTQNVLAVCDFNLCFTYVLAGTTGNSHDARILARAIDNPELEFPHPAPGKYYLVDSGFAHRPGYMAPYRGSDILYHFQQFYDGDTGRRRNFRNARGKFNFRHSSCRNVIERAFGVWKSRWKILDRMPSYAFDVQTHVVIATMGIHNFLRRAGVVNEAFVQAETDPDAAEVELPSTRDEASAKMNAPESRRDEWNMFGDYLAQQ